MNRITFRTLAMLMALPLFAPAASAEDDKKAAELKWAKGVATDFLTSAFNGNLEQAESLIDASLKKAFAKSGEKREREWLNNRIGIQGFHTPAIASEQMAPDQDEACFKGTFKSKDNPYDFTLRVIKDKEGGKWRVCYFHFDPSENPKPKTIP